MNRPRLAPKNSVTRHVQEAKIAWERRDLSRCINQLERASREAPSDIGILIWLGGVHGLQYDYAAAEKCFEKACRNAPPEQKAATLLSAAQQAQNFFNPDLAHRFFRRVAEDPGATPEMFATLAEFCERHRDLDQAHAHVERALGRQESCESAILVRARLRQREEKFEEAERDLRNLLERTESTEIRIRAGSELGTVLDRQGRYDEAMAAFVEAKDLLRPAAEHQAAPRQFVRQQLSQMRAQLSKETLQRWSDFGRNLHPPRRLAVLAGHPRSGTTLLEQVLDAHPQLVSIEETTHFTDYAFNPLKRRWPIDTPILEVLESATRELLESYRNRYFRAADLCIGAPVGDRLLIDKNPALTVQVPAVLRVFPEARFLVLIRDPRDVVLSCFLQPVLSVRKVSYPYTSLKTTVESYAGLMSTWRTVAPLLPSPYREIRYENLVDDLPSAARHALEFLGVPWNEAVLNFDQHAQRKTVRSPAYADVTRKVFKRARGRWRNYQKYLEPHLDILEPFVKAYGYG